MTYQDRRQVSRTSVQRLTYIHLEPRNGGRILNISEGGLCFHAVVPVAQEGPVRFRLSEPDLQVEADGELVWTDAMRKKGGLRFINLSSEARQQIHDWINQPAAAPAPAAAVAAREATPHASTALKLALGMPSKANPAQAKKIAAVFRQPSASSSEHPAGTPADVLRAAFSVRGAVPYWKRFASLRTFSSGLVTGLLVSTVVLLAFWFQTHRRQLGDSLVHWGQRLGASSQPDTVRAEPQIAPVQNSAATASQPQLNSPESYSPQQPQARPSVAVPVSSPARTNGGIARQEPKAQALEKGKLKAQPTGKTEPKTKGSKREPAKIESGRRVGPLPSASTFTLTGVPAALPVLPSESSPVTSPTDVPQLASDSVPPAVPTESADASRRIEVSNTPSVGALPERYLEIAKFKEKPRAEHIRDRLEGLGFHSIITQQGHLLSNSYHVLAGPYSNESEIESAHNGLTSHGFKPRFFEKGSRDFRLRSQLMVNGNRIPTGDCTISWESYGPSAIVRFEENTGRLLTKPVLIRAEGKLVKHPTWYHQDAVVYTIGRDGSRKLLEIQLSGTNQSLIFPKAS